MKYRNRRGSLHIGMRVEKAAALLASILANYWRDPKIRPEPFKPDDFCPHADQQIVSIEQAMKEWS